MAPTNAIASTLEMLSTHARMSCPGRHAGRHAGHSIVEVSRVLYTRALQTFDDGTLDIGK